MEITLINGISHTLMSKTNSSFHTDYILLRSGKNNVMGVFDDF